MNLSSACIKRSYINPQKISICMTQRKTLSFNILIWMSTSKTKTFRRIKNFALNMVKIMPLIAQEIRCVMGIRPAIELRL